MKYIVNILTKRKAEKIGEAAEAGAETRNVISKKKRSNVVGEVEVEVGSSSQLSLCPLSFSLSRLIFFYSTFRVFFFFFKKKYLSAVNQRIIMLSTSLIKKF